MTLAARFQRLFTRYNVTQSEVASVAGISRQQLSEIMRGINTNPGVVLVQRIVEAAGGTMAEFWADED